MLMKKYIITTTIFPPTEAIRKYASFDDWHLIVVADKKTPIELYKNINCEILTEDHQEKYKALSDLIGWNCAERKTLGVLEAYKRGADIIAIVDDDNIPLDNWLDVQYVGKEIEVNYVETDEMCFDPLLYSNYPQLWHRGYPLQLMQRRQGNLTKKKVKVDVQAGLWNGEPDVDAVCRMLYGPFNVTFDKSAFPLSSNTFSPYNSQNTILSRDAVKYYYMMHDTGRMTDIWASLYCQANGFNVVYTESTVFHDRNVHDDSADFKEEVLGINTIDLILALMENPEYIHKFIPSRTYLGLIEYRRLVNEI